MSFLKSLLIALLLSISLYALSFEVKAYPRFSFAPATERVTVTLPPDPFNASLCIEVDGPMYLSSCRELDGQRAAVQAQWTFPGLSVGHYDVRATVTRTDRTTKSVSSGFEVLGERTDGEP